MEIGARPYPTGLRGVRIMVFVDGENLAARYAEVLGSETPVEHVTHKPGVYVLTPVLLRVGNPIVPVIRHYYYTSVHGSEEIREKIHDDLARIGIEAPRVFPKRKGKRSKRVDISLSVDMLSHAHRKNYDLAVLVAGDEDYVPLVQAVEAEGCRVVLWFFSNGLSTALRRHVDHYFDLAHAFRMPLTAEGQLYRKGNYL